MKNALCIFVLLVLIFYSCKNLYAQEIRENSNYSSNAVYAELLGPGAGGSINYERFFSDHFLVRGGIGGLVYGDVTGTVSIVTFPILSDYLFNFGNSHIELGAGVTTLYGFASRYSTINFGYISYRDTSSGQGWRALFVGEIAYRYQRPTGGFLFKVGATPMYSARSGYITSFELSAGYSF
jgi:hypothetical protein